MKLVIKTDKLCKYYGKGSEIKAVDELDLEVYEGETLGLLGPNGAGKTTTVRLLNCIIKPTSGTAAMNGYDIHKEENKVKKVTGLLAEPPGLYEKSEIRRAVVPLACKVKRVTPLFFSVSPLGRPSSFEHSCFIRFLIFGFGGQVLGYSKW